MIEVFYFDTMASCYILFSEKLNRHYIGATNNEVAERIEKHNNHSYGKTHFTATASDWKLVLNLPAEDFSHAIKIEKHIKKMKSSVFIHNLIEYSDLQVKTIERTRSTSLDKRR